MDISKIKNSLKEGDLVILTRHLEKWYRELNTDFNIMISNRIAKIIKIFDWDSKEGKLLLEERKGPKWSNLNPKDFQYVIEIYYPELILKESNEVKIPEVVPLCFPGTDALLFFPMPKWMCSDIIKEAKKQTFSVIERDAKALEREILNKKKPIIKKKVAKKKVAKKKAVAKKKPAIRKR